MTDPAPPTETGASAVVLIAEDNAMVGLLMQTDLQDAGYVVLGPYARRGEALAAAEGGRVDLALLDIDLAGGDSGVDLAADLQAAHGTPCLFVTGQTHDAASSGTPALGTLTKPFASRVLVAAVADALLRARGEAGSNAASGVRWF